MVHKTNKKKKNHNGHKVHSPIKKMENNESVMHTMLTAPKTLQKEILSAAIDTVRLLKRHQRYKELNLLKEDLHTRLKEIVTDIKELSKEIRTEELPVSLKELLDMPRFKTIKESPKEEEIKSPKRSRVSIKPKVQTNKLESDLAILKQKLAKI